MSVLIKGMEMPTSGGVIAVYKIKGEFLASYGGTSDICPIIPVPPHERLIDADEALIDADERGFDFWASDADIDSAHEFLKAQLTVIEAEEGDNYETTD